VAEQPDGKIVVVGTRLPQLRAGVTWPGPALVVARYLVDGQLDPSFGTRGEVTIKMSLGSFGKAVAIQPDGRIVVSGAFESGTVHPLLVRFNGDGMADRGFGANGVVVSDDFGTLSQLALADDGGIIVVNQDEKRLLRYDAGGRPDPSFVTAGQVSPPIGGGALAIQGDGKLLVSDVSEGRSVLARYGRDGKLDGSFGTGGVVVTAMPRDVEGTGAIALARDGRIVVSFGWVLARYAPDGTSIRASGLRVSRTSRRRAVTKAVGSSSSPTAGSSSARSTRSCSA
jgi:uncharacterized delta-60 repeat protein